MPGPIYGVEPGQTPVLLGEAAAANDPTTDPTAFRAAFVRNGTLTVLPVPAVGVGTYALGMNASGTVILGETIDPAALGHYRGIIWSNGTVIDLGRDLIPDWVNSKGDVVVKDTAQNTTLLWRAGKTYTIQVVDGSDGTTLTGVRIAALLDNGRAVGAQWPNTIAPDQYYALTPE